MSVTVYTTTNCVQCEQTKRVLTARGVGYDTIDLSENKEALEYVLSLGFSSAPVVITDNDMWSGFRIDKLNSLPISANN